MGAVVDGWVVGWLGAFGYEKKNISGLLLCLVLSLPLAYIYIFTYRYHEWYETYLVWRLTGSCLVEHSLFLFGDAAAPKKRLVEMRRVESSSRREVEGSGGIRYLLR